MDVQWGKHNMNATIAYESYTAPTDDHKDDGALPGLGARAFQAPLLDLACWSHLWLGVWASV